MGWSSIYDNVKILKMSTSKLDSVSTHVSYVVGYLNLKDCVDEMVETGVMIDKDGHSLEYLESKLELYRNRLLEYKEFKFIINDRTVEQKLRKRQKLLTKKSLMDTFVGDLPHHKWKTAEEFDNDWRDYHCTEEYVLVDRKSRKRRRVESSTE